MKANQTYIERSFYHWALFLRVNESHSEGTPLNVVASHSTTPRHKSMPMPQVHVIDRHLMTCGHQHRY